MHQALPLVYDLNFLLVEGACSCSGTEIADEAERLMAPLGLKHRQLIVEGERDGKRLAGEMDALGWKVDRCVIMVHRREPDRESDTAEVTVVSDAEIWPSRERWLRTYEWCRDDETVAQMQSAYRIWKNTAGGLDFAIYRDGVPVSFAMLWFGDGVAQIEDVATLEGYRNQGLSRKVVTRAVDEARRRGCTTVFLIADDDDWPKELYAKLGFDPVGMDYLFLKTNS